MGRKVCFEDPHGVEFDNRVAKAWGAFSKHKKELTDRRHRLQNRLRLFNAVVTATMLYGCEAWTLKVDQQKRLRTIQRKMLRMVLNTKRRTMTTSSSSDSDAPEDGGDADNLEPWPEFLKRTAQWSDEQLKKANAQQWTDCWLTKIGNGHPNYLELTRRRGVLQPHGGNPFFIRSLLVDVGRHAQREDGKRTSWSTWRQRASPEDGRKWQDIAKDSEWWLTETGKSANS